MSKIQVGYLILISIFIGTTIFLGVNRGIEHAVLYVAIIGLLGLVFFMAIRWITEDR